MGAKKEVKKVKKEEVVQKSALELAVDSLNESGLLEEELEFEGDSEEMVEKFMQAVESIPSEKEDDIPGGVVNTYNDLVDAAEKKEKETKAKAKEAKKEKSAKAKEAKKEKPAKAEGAGVIGSILDFIKTSGPITKEQILNKLVKKFPEREKEAMKKTVMVQLGGKPDKPSRMEKEKEVVFKRVDNGKGEISFSL